MSTTWVVDSDGNMKLKPGKDWRDVAWEMTVDVKDLRKGVVLAVESLAKTMMQRQGVEAIVENEIGRLCEVAVKKATDEMLQKINRSAAAAIEKRIHEAISAADIRLDCSVLFKEDSK